MSHSRVPSSDDNENSSFYVERPTRYDYRQRTQDQLVEDVNVAHRFIRKLVHEKDRLDRRAEFAKFEIRMLETVTGGMFLVLIALLKMVLSK